MWGSCGVSHLYLHTLPSTRKHLCLVMPKFVVAGGGSVVSSLAMKSLDMARRQWPSVAATQGSTKEGQELSRGQCLPWLPRSATYSLHYLSVCKQADPQGSI